MPLYDRKRDLSCKATKLDIGLAVGSSVSPKISSEYLFHWKFTPVWIYSHASSSVLRVTLLYLVKCISWASSQSHCGWRCKPLLISVRPMCCVPWVTLSRTSLKSFPRWIITLMLPWTTVTPGYQRLSIDGPLLCTDSEAGSTPRAFPMLWFEVP